MAKPSTMVDAKSAFELGVGLSGDQTGETISGTLENLQKLGLGDIVARVLNVAANMNDRSID
jgi:hypothetical protein